MRSPPSSLERFLKLVLALFIAVDIILIVPAYASELRLDLIHPSLPVLRLNSLRLPDFQFLGKRAQISQADFASLAIPSKSLDSAGPTPTPVPNPTPNVYRVQSGDTLGRIARAHGTTVNAIAAANRVSNPDLIFVGQKLVIPPNSTPESNDEGQVPTPLWSSTASPAFAGIQLPSQIPSATLILEATPSAPTQPPTLAPLTTQIPSPTSFPSSTSIPTAMATSTQIPSYTPTSISVQTQQIPSMTPSQVAAITATIVCTALPVTACQTSPDPRSSPTAITTSTPSPTHTQTALPIPTNAGPVRAFPGAEGFGAGSVGGRGGRVIEVTNLDNSGPGSLRAAVEAEGARIVVFRVGGTITLQSSLKITNPFITIAGQTAPGGGITLKSSPSYSKGTLAIQTHDVIIRYLRVRSGKSTEVSSNRDGIVIGHASTAVYNVIIDHSSISWATDENISTWYETYDITIQWSIISEGLHDSTHSEGPHSKGMLLGSSGSKNISVHHNLFAHNNDRNPRIKTSGTVDVVNNVIYNPGFGSPNDWGPSHITDDYTKVPVNYVGNFYKAGRNSGTANYYVSGSGSGTGNLAEIYIHGNITPERSTDNLDEIEGVVRPGQQSWVVPTRHPAPAVTTTSAFEAYESVLANAGATLPMRDEVDERILNDVMNGSGQIIDDPSEVGGWPELPAGTAPLDTDHDGMPNEWENLYCFDPNDPSDGPADADGDGYTNVEEFLNGTQPIAGGPC